MKKIKSIIILMLGNIFKVSNKEKEELSIVMEVFTLDNF